MSLSYEHRAGEKKKEKNQSFNIFLKFPLNILSPFLQVQSYEKLIIRVPLPLLSHKGILLGRKYKYKLEINSVFQTKSWI